MSKITSQEINQELLRGWILHLGTMPTITSTTDGVDSLAITDDLTSDYQKGDWVKITSDAGTDLIYKVYSLTAVELKVVGETSVSGTVTAMSFSKEHSPQGAIAWENLFLASCYKSTNTIVPTGTITSVAIDSYIYGTDSALMSGGGFVTKVTGTYNFLASIYFDNIADYSQVGIQINGDVYGSSGRGAVQHPTGVFTASLKRGDLVELTAFQYSGSDKNVVGGSDTSSLAINFISI